mgnify:CR=1 FL=1
MNNEKWIMNNVFVGEDIILPRSLRSQNAHPSVAQKRDLQEPSLVREGGPLAVDE